MAVECTMVLWGGELDGDEVKISPLERPDITYAVPHKDQVKIEACKSARTKQELREKLAVLAYQFDPAASTVDRFIMRRAPQLDRVIQR